MLILRPMYLNVNMVDLRGADWMIIYEHMLSYYLIGHYEQGVDKSVNLVYIAKYRRSISGTNTGKQQGALGLIELNIYYIICSGRNSQNIYVLCERLLGESKESLIKNTHNFYIEEKLDVARKLATCTRTTPL